MEILLIVISLISSSISIVAIFLALEIKSKLKKMFSDGSIKESFSQDLEQYYKETKLALCQYNNLNEDIKELKNNNTKNLSSFSIRRFNPYEEAGGDLSFCIAVLDRDKNGYMITSLHGRERTRIYTRNILIGEINTELLFDEKETLKEALEKIK